MPDYRVFVSYSRSERETFDAVCEALRRVGLTPWSDQDLSVGPTGFTEQIQLCIAHSHLFVPIITPVSHARGWVHQEIGFAVGMRVPVIPICVGQLPEGMIHMAQAIVVDDVSTECLDRLRRHNFEELVLEAGKKWMPSGECAQEVGERAEMIERHADEGRRRLGPQCVRHNGGLSSFRIPDESPSRPVWASHYGAHSKGEERYKKLRRERQALVHHASTAGCKLIINYGIDLDAAYGAGVWRSRIKTLVEFLETMSDDRAEIALVTNAPHTAFLAVGNWFLAESAAVRPVSGIRHTLFTFYAPLIDQRITEFDADLNKLLEEQQRDGCIPGKSRAWAIEVLRQRMTELPDFGSTT